MVNNSTPINEVLPPIDGFACNPALGFGEKVAGWPVELTVCQRIRSMAVPFFFGLAVVAAGALLSTLVGIPVALIAGKIAAIGIGAGIGATVGFVTLCVLYVQLVRLLHQPIPDTGHMVPNVKTEDAIPLGKFSDDNSGFYTRHAKETSQWKLDLIRNAKQSIELSANFCGGQLFREALDAIEETIERSVKEGGNLQVYFLGTDSPVIESEDKDKLKALQQKYPDNFHCLMIDEQISLNQSIRKQGNHVKLLTVDEKFYVIGGTNLEHRMGSYSGAKDLEHSPNAGIFDRTMPIGFRDKDVVCTGAHAKTLRLEFFKLWATWELRSGAKKTLDVATKYFAIDPARQASSQKWEKAVADGRVVKKLNSKVLVSDIMKPNAITAEHVRMIDSATKVVRIASFAFNPHSEIVEALKRAFKRGVKVRVITNGYISGSPLANLGFVKANRYKYLDLQEAGGRLFKVFEYAVKNVNYHCKFMIVDEDKSIIGCYNQNPRSYECDDELTLTVESKEATAQVLKSFKKDIKSSKLMSQEDMEGSCCDRILAWLQSHTVAYFF